METKQTIFSKISNIAFLVISIYLLFFLWSLYYTNSIINATFAAFLFLIGFCLIFFPIRKHIIKRKNNTREQQTLQENLIIQLKFNKLDDTIELITNLYNISNYKKFSSNHIYTEDCDYYFYFQDDKINDIEIYQTRKTNNLVIFSLNKPIIKEFENINLNIITFESLYSEFKNKSQLPQTTIEIKNSPKIQLKDIFQLIFNKSKSKNYLFLGLLVLFSSLFTIYSTYYIIISTILIVLAIYSRFNRKFNNYNK